jgi:hypothetical protein
MLMLARLLHHRVAGVVVREREHRVVLLHEATELLGVFERRRHRLVADDVESRLDERLRDLEVRDVRRDDGNEVDALTLGQLPLAVDHVLPRCVDAEWIEVQRLALLARLLGVGRERARDERDLAIEGGGLPVHRADEGARTAADHSESQGPLKRHELRGSGVRFGKRAAARPLEIGR